MANRRQRRKTEKGRRHAPRSVPAPVAADGNADGRLESLVYSREQAAQALGISLATLDRRVIPAVETVKTEWGARLIPAAEFELSRRTHRGAAGTTSTRNASWPKVHAPARGHRADSQ